jgi:hypothetical protein
VASHAPWVCCGLFWRRHLVLEHSAGQYIGHVPLYTIRDCDSVSSTLNTFLSGEPGASLK